MGDDHTKCCREGKELLKIMNDATKSFDERMKARKKLLELIKKEIYDDNNCNIIDEIIGDIARYAMYLTPIEVSEITKKLITKFANIESGTSYENFEEYLKKSVADAADAESKAKDEKIADLERQLAALKASK
jgi:hypothetical protein